MPKQRINVKSRADLENELGYTFKKQELLWQALTHASAIKEGHPDAFEHDLLPLAFVGDAVIKYAVARYLFLNKGNDVITIPAELHNRTQAVITNVVLARIARQELHLEEYLIRGNGHNDLSEYMYASCMEAIFGAIALDGGNDQRAIFSVVENLYTQRSERLLGKTDEYRGVVAWPKEELESVVHDQISNTLSNTRSCSQWFGQACLWFFAVFGLIAFYLIVVIGFTMLMEKKSSTFTPEL